MQFANIIASALLVAGSLAAPHPATHDVATRSEVSPRESWALALKARDAASANTKRGDGADLNAREYWASWAFKLRDGAQAKRSILESACEFAEEGIYCNYTNDDVVAYDGPNTKLQNGCATVDHGVTCFYPGSFESIRD